jgi:mRNA-degrading endonuclease RelE of RelBE toxin-antitoxin system
MLLQTERNSNIYSKENKTENIFHKRKPYSDYFRSRIFEIPIELNIKNDHNTIEIQTFDKKLQSIEVQT